MEIRPGELFESKTLVTSRYLEVVNKPIVKKKGPPKKINLFEEKLNGTSSNKS